MGYNPKINSEKWGPTQGELCSRISIILL